jgi:prepilin signal peptidase PulO-like enzyme (type II secretory pathway)
MYFSTLLFVTGLIFGSFLAAFSWRYPRDISISKGRSSCPHCHHQLAWYDNIPLVSFLLLMGKCRYCRKKISFRYPTIELLTGLGFLFIWSMHLSIFYTAFYLAVFSVLVAVFIIDWEHQIIPDSLVFILLILTFVKYFAYNDTGIYGAILTGLLSALFLLMLHIVTKGKGMGLGDVKFAVFGGLFLGSEKVFLWFLFAFLTGALYGIILISVRKAKLKDHVAFGPFLIISLILVEVFFDNLVQILYL